MKLGIMTVGQESDESLAAAGFGGVAIGDTTANWEALVDDLNARGGVGGRQVVPVFAYVDIISTAPEPELQAACTRFTQDDPVFAVASDVIFHESLVGCLQDAGLPVLYSDGAALDAHGMPQHPTTFVIAGPNLSRLAAFLPRGLAAAEFFVPEVPATPVKVGLIRVDLPAYERATTEVLRPALAAAGVNLDEEVAVTPAASGRVGDLAAQLASAVLQFRSSAITHVLFLSTNSTEPVLFMGSAESQAYRPRYGLSSQQVPQGVVSAVPAEQLRSALGVGWSPTADVAPSEDPGDVTAFARCIETIRAAGQPLESRTEQYVAAASCEMLGFFAAGGGRMTPATQAAFVAAGEALGGDHVSAVTWRTAFAPGHHDGGAVYRPFLFDAACTCFRYTAGDQPMNR